MRTFIFALEVATRDSTVIAVMPFCLFNLCGFMCLGFLALDQQFTLDGELIRLQVPL